MSKVFNSFETFKNVIYLKKRIKNTPPFLSLSPSNKLNSFMIVHYGAGFTSKKITPNYVKFFYEQITALYSTTDWIGEQEITIYSYWKEQFKSETKVDKIPPFVMKIVFSFLRFESSILL